MDLHDNGNHYEAPLIQHSETGGLEVCTEDFRDESLDIEANIETTCNHNEGSEKHNAIWTMDAISTLLKLYEIKLKMLETPKKKTRIWIAISENLKDNGIDMTPDQVRWKINALTKKYKQCIDTGQHSKFRYFNEIDNIYAQYNVDCDAYTITELKHKKRSSNKAKERFICSNETRSSIELRKIRLANRIESDKNQGKIQLEKQWLEYLKRQEDQKHLKDQMFMKSLKLREDQLELHRREIVFKEAHEYRTLQLKEKEQEELLKLEREKCDLLKQLFTG